MPSKVKKDNEDSKISSSASIDAALSRSSSVFVLAKDGFGKTFILKRLAGKKNSNSVNSVYIDLKSLASSPENFAVDFISAITDTDAQDIIALAALKLKSSSAGIIAKIANELQKIKPDQRLIIEQAFDFPEAFASDSNKDILLLLDNFDELLSLNNFSAIKDIVKLILARIDKNSRAKFVFASSAVNTVASMLKREKKESLELGALSEQDTGILFESVAGKTDSRIISAVHSLTGGIPIAILTVARIFSSKKTGNVTSDSSLVRDLLVAELCTAGSPAYAHFSRVFSDSMNRARGASLLKTILKVISLNKPLRLTEISKLIYRSAPVTKSLLERLIEADLVTKSDNVFDFSDPVLKLWCSLMFRNIQFEDIEDARKNAGGLLR